MRRVLFLTTAAFVLALGLAACGEKQEAVTASPTGSAPTQATPEAATFTDPFKYCIAVGTIDAPDSRYTGPTVPNAVKEGLRNMGHPASEAGTVWRCMDGKLFACNGGANLTCSGANASTEPSPDMVQWCKENPDSHIPATITGHATIYIWDCQGNVPRIVQQVFTVDPSGFIADSWFEIRP